VLGPTRTHRDHVAVRFGDHPHGPNRPGVRVWLNGQDVTARCLEAMRNGESGWAILMTDPQEPCPNGGSHVRSTLHYGQVFIAHPAPSG
jgi:hypothetical protein